MPMPRPEEIAEKQIRRVQQASEDVRAGVQRVDEAPGAKAAAKQEKLVQAFLEAIRTGKWQTRVAGVTLEEWRQAMLSKGVPRIAEGIAAARGDIEDFWREFLPHLERVVAEVERMPDTTLEERIQRAVAQMRGAARFTRGGGTRR